MSARNGGVARDDRLSQTKPSRLYRETSSHEELLAINRFNVSTRRSAVKKSRSKGRNQVFADQLTSAACITSRIADPIRSRATPPEIESQSESVVLSWISKGVSECGKEECTHAHEMTAVKQEERRGLRVKLSGSRAERGIPDEERLAQTATLRHSRSPWAPVGLRSAGYCIHAASR